MLPVRGINVCESLARHTSDQVDRLLHRLHEWGMNTLVVHPQYGYRLYEPIIRRRCEELGITLVQYIYTSLAFLRGAPAACFARDHEGRPRTPELVCETRPCSSDSASLDWFRDGARRYFDQKTRPGDHVLLATADGYLLCQCPRCRQRSAIDQWQPLLEVAVDEARRSGRNLKLHFISYIRRFALPRDMSIFSEIDAVMFDLHLRFRWAAMDEDHPRAGLEDLESPVDARAGEVPMNRYMLDRLGEWRAAFKGQLYVFENLMLQSTMSLPQPNTGALLRDLDTYERMGIDGVVYEAFEPGIASFTDQIAKLAARMRGQAVHHVAGELERACPSELAGPARSWPYLVTDQFDGMKMLAAYMADPVLLEHARRLRQYLLEKTLVNWKQVVCFAMQHRERLDWLHIAFLLMDWLPAELKPTHDDPQVREFLTVTKLWDFMERQADPIADTEAVIRKLLA